MGIVSLTHLERNKAKERKRRLRKLKNFANVVGMTKTAHLSAQSNSSESSATQVFVTAEASSSLVHAQKQVLDIFLDHDDVPTSEAIRDPPSNPESVVAMWTLVGLAFAGL